MKTPINPANYQSYRGLPPLAGLCSFAEAARTGLAVEACVARLKRYHYAFVRLHESSQFPGTGLGLTIVRRVIERHGGTVRAESSPGIGSTFFFSLPKSHLD